MISGNIRAKFIFNQKQMKVFIDTNIYLTFYHYTSEDLEELKKLSVAIQNKKIDLQLTDLVISEFKRNREAKIFDALKKFEDQKLNDQFPQICKEYPEYAQLKNAIRGYEESKDKIMKKLSKDIEMMKLGADKIIHDLFKKGNVHKTDDKNLEKARTRIDFGNPPGKNNSLGDAINWEILLSEIPERDDLYLISDDKDYRSPINENMLAKFLDDEWQEAKNSKIYFYRRLSDFFCDKFPQIKLASEFEKELAISDLAVSSNFNDTHKIIAKLSKYADFTDQQMNEIIEAAINNNQVYWLKNDEDVKTFFNNLLKNRERTIESDKLEKFVELFPSIKEEEPAELDDLPF